ncbi:PASTA domain-containing protein [Streptomyces sp. NBC_00243]|uniref:PASTA domain-containing protein n=1 Tax=Streptomyces sp. NBC_00243 TaxID=2975688 RepID=UPI002DD997B8|nr:PASTA domain-containing protein [Streptomyces sp. NBC_00243]WRZ24243.1 PASTA domain-containing protein [Streptomyces sp. NBC_00243]
MTFRASMQRAGLTAARRIALLLVGVLMVSGCSKSEQLSVVRAIAAGISQANPFFSEDGSLGKDMSLPEARPSGGIQASNSPGLYGGATGGDDGATGGDDGSSGPGDDDEATGEFGGSTKPGTCDAEKLKNFLTDSKNSAKAQEWARVRNIGTDEIAGHIDQLTPVVLRHDTLVTNHEYKDGKAVPFDALLQTGIAILVDRQGLPAVKCSCGNPLLPYEGNVEKTSVQFKDGNKKWAGYQQDRIVVVKPPPGDQKIERLQLVDVHDPDHGINRPVGTEGEADKSFDTHAELRVPAVTGTTFAAAAQHLADSGLVMTYDGGSLPADDALVTASRPAEGSTLEWGAAVALFVQGGPDDSGGGTTTPPDSGAASTGPGGSSTGPGESSSGPGGSSTGPGESSTGSGGSDPSPGTTSPTPSNGSSGPSSPGGGSPSGGGSDSPGTSTPPGSGSGGGTSSLPPPSSQTPPSTPPPSTPTSASAAPTKTESASAGPTATGPTATAPSSAEPTSGSAPASSALS